MFFAKLIVFSPLGPIVLLRSVGVALCRDVTGMEKAAFTVSRHIMLIKHLSEPWFSLLYAGKKSIEVRLDKGHFHELKAQDTSNDSFPSLLSFLARSSRVLQRRSRLQRPAKVLRSRSLSRAVRELRVSPGETPRPSLAHGEVDRVRLSDLESILRQGERRSNAEETGDQTRTDQCDGQRGLGQWQFVLTGNSSSSSWLIVPSLSFSFIR